MRDSSMLNSIYVEKKWEKYTTWKLMLMGVTWHS